MPRKQAALLRTEVALRELGLIDAAREQLEVSTGLAPGDTLLLGGARGIPAGSSVQVGVAAGKE